MDVNGCKSNRDTTSIGLPIVTNDHHVWSSHMMPHMMPPGWWFGTFFTFPNIGYVIIPIDAVIFFRWGRVETTNQIFIDSPLIIHRLSIDYPLIIHRLSIDYPYTNHIIHRLSTYDHHILCQTSWFQGGASSWPCWSPLAALASLWSLQMSRPRRSRREPGTRWCPGEIFP